MPSRHSGQPGKKAINMFPFPFTNSDYGDIHQRYDQQCLVMEGQIHTHNTGCFPPSAKHCRFNLGRDMRAEPLLEDSGKFSASRNHPYLNNFNPHILSCIRSNMDIKWIPGSEDFRALMYYIVKYISNEERNFRSMYDLCSQAVTRIINASPATLSESDETARKLITACYFRLQTGKEIGAPFSCFLQLGFSPFYCSDSFEPIYISALLRKAYKQDWVKSALFDDDASDDESDQVSEAGDDNETEFDTTFILNNLVTDEHGVAHLPVPVNLITDYLYRPVDLEGFSVYEYVSFYKKIKGFPKSHLLLHPSHPQVSTHSVTRRKSAITPMVIGYSLPSPTQLEKRNCYLCVLLAPYRDASVLKCKETWAETWTFFQRSGAITSFANIIFGNIQGMFGDESPPRVQMKGDPKPSSIAFPSLAVQAVDRSLVDQLETLSALACSYVSSFPSGLTTIMDGIPRQHSFNNYGIPDLDEAALKAFKKSFGVESGPATTSSQSVFNLDFQESVIVPIPNVKSLVRQLALKHSLSRDQAIAFYTFVDVHQSVQSQVFASEEGLVNNVVMLLGEGGTGKSRIIKAIDDYFKTIRDHPALASTAGTGAAAFAIHGCTVHSLLGLCSQNPNMDKIRAALHQIESLIIDEVFTIGLTLLAKISSILQAVTDSDLPFGGLVLLLCGDPLQFEPVLQVPLFAPMADFLSKSSGKKRKLEEVQSLSTGAALMNSIQNAIILFRQWRIQCPVLLRILDHIRKNTCTQEDVDCLNARFIGRLSEQEISRFSKATIVVERNDMRARFNTIATLKFLHRFDLSDSSVPAVALDTIAREKPEPEIRRLLLQLHDTSARMPGLMKLAKGVPVLLRENVYQSLGVCNGAIGFVSILPPGLPYVGVFFDHLKDFPAFIEGFPQGVVPITRTNSSFEMPGNCSIKVSRTQFPFCPAFALTCFAVQGRTLADGMVCQIDTSNKHYIYVCLSRIRRLDDLVLLNEVSLVQLSQPWNPQLKTFIKKFDALNAATRNRIVSKYSDILEGIEE